MGRRGGYALGDALGHVLGYALGYAPRAGIRR